MITVGVFVGILDLKNCVKHYGLKSPQQKEILKKYWSSDIKNLLLKEQISLIKLLLNESHFESKNIGIEILNKIHKPMINEKLLIQFLKKDLLIIIKNNCNNWAVSDAISKFIRLSIQYYEKNT